MGKALDGVERILDFTHVQSGPTCTQLLAWFGADVIKIERPGDGRHHARPAPRHPGRRQPLLHDAEPQQALDHASTPRTRKGKSVLDALIKHCDVLVENFAPGALDRMGFTWEYIHKLNPRMIVASVKGFGPGPYEDCKVYENVAQCTGGSASTTGFREGPPLVTGAQIGDSGTGPAPGARHRRGALSAQHAPAAARRSSRRCRTACSISAASSCATSSACTHGPLKEYRQFGENIPFGEVGAALRQRFGRRPAGLDPQVQGLGDGSRTPTSTSSPRRRCGRRSAT